jgi:hypothetical protein
LLVLLWRGVFFAEFPFQALQLSVLPEGTKLALAPRPGLPRLRLQAELPAEARLLHLRQIAELFFC